MKVCIYIYIYNVCIQTHTRTHTHTHTYMVIKIIGPGCVFYRFGLLPLSMSNVRKPKLSSHRVSSHPPVSVTADVQCSSVYTLTKHHIPSFSFL